MRFRWPFSSMAPVWLYLAVIMVMSAVPMAHAQASMARVTSEALTFINHKFVPSCSGNICSRNEVLSISGGKLSLAEDYEEDRNGTPENSHYVATVDANGVNLDSLKVSRGVDTDQIEIDCKGKNQCVSSIETSAKKGTQTFSKDHLYIGDFSHKDTNEVGSYLKRLLAVQQGGHISAVEHEPTEQEALAFLQAHIASTFEMPNGITALHRGLTVQGDELIEAEELLQYGSRPDHLIVRVNLKDLDDLVVSDNSEILMTCGVVGERRANCFSADTGQSSSDLVIAGVSNPKQSASMLRRLIMLHK